jgi:uncharacterized protein
MKKFLLLISMMVIAAGVVMAYSSPGSPTGYVNDFAGVLSAETKQQLETRLSSLDASTSAQVSVVTIKNLGGDTVEDYANKLFADWGIGQKGKDNGVLLLVAVDDREMRIEVGYGLEGALTDAESSWIIRDKITPRFKEGNYDQGVIDGVEGILSAASEDLIPISVEKTFNASAGFMEDAFPALIFGFMALQWVWAILARTKSWWLGGVIGAIAGVIFGGVTGMMLLGLFGLLLDWLVSKEYKKSTETGHYPWWIGGKSGFGGGFSGGRSGGFGGFGGGRSGGGGSSGRW